jgi:hypothetical protein
MKKIFLLSLLIFLLALSPTAQQYSRGAILDAEIYNRLS